MFEFLRQPDSASQVNDRGFLKRAGRNFLRLAGFSPGSSDRPRRRKGFAGRSSRNKHDSPMSRHRRRQITQKITNGVLIGVFSLGVAWFMTRQPQGGAFSIPQTRQTATRTAAVSNTNANTRGAGSVGYRLNAGPYAVTEAPDITLHDAKRNRDVHVRVLYPNAQERN